MYLKFSYKELYLNYINQLIIINIVLSHPKMDGVIDCHGINLIEGNY